MTRVLRLTAFAIAAWAAAIGSGMAQGCQYDTQCKGDRICVNGTCTAPDDSAPQGSGGPALSRGLVAPAQQSLPQFCCTPIGKLGPYANPGVNGIPVPLGGQCYGMTPTGPAFGVACR